MTPEAKARQLIDQKLEQAGWVLQTCSNLIWVQPPVSQDPNDEPASALLERMRMNMKRQTQSQSVRKVQSFRMRKEKT